MAGWYAIARLTALLTCVGVATSRVGLVIHELVGHGLTTLAVGGEVTEVRLFYLAGGWVRYRLGEPGGALAISLGGIVIEVVVGAALWIALSRRTALGARIVRAVGAALVIHATWYLATGTWHGFGDGALLHQRLGGGRWLVAIPAAAVTCAIAFAAARAVLGVLAGAVPGGRGRRIAGVAVACVLAGGLQLGAALAEVAVRRDPTYATTMRPQRDRVIARELAAWTERQARDGAAPTEGARAEMRRQLARDHREFPFAYVLGGLVLGSIALGAARSRVVTGELPHRLLVRAAAAAGGSVALVVALATAFH